MLDDSAQVSTEYLLLVAVGLAVIIVGIGIAMQLRGMADVVATRVQAERNSTLQMLTHQ